VSKFGRLRKTIKAASAKPAVERLVAVGLIRDGVTHGADRGFKEHWRLRGALGDEDPYEKKATDEYGFITSTGRFVDRGEAQIIGEEAGQCQPMRRELLSSDIDW
jgi:hypothetical protein